MSEGVSSADGPTGGGTDGAVVGPFSAGVPARGALEGAGGLDGLLPGRDGRGLGEGVENLAEPREVGGGILLITVGESRGRVVDDGGGFTAGTGRRCSSGVRTGVGSSSVGCLVGAEALADFGEGEVGGETGAGEPDRLACVVTVAGQGDLVSEHVAGGGGALVDADSGFGEAAEELCLVLGAGRGLADVVAQKFAGGGGAARAFGFGSLGAGGPLDWVPSPGLRRLSPRSASISRHPLARGGSRRDGVGSGRPGV
ncbi:hypothetical protein [Streptomyces sp. NRRL S-1868]|uniref:hypothetical protein n=1 Tax=Streptomyces sp. NRRL S-1868 TaxID=1463892 RepID=UPI003B63C81D